MVEVSRFVERLSLWFGAGFWRSCSSMLFSGFIDSDEHSPAGVALSTGQLDALSPVPCELYAIVFQHLLHRVREGSRPAAAAGGAALFAALTAAKNGDSLVPS